MGREWGHLRSFRIFTVTFHRRLRAGVSAGVLERPDGMIRGEGAGREGFR